MGLPDRLFQELDEALDRPGFFFTAWGGMYLDFGLWLSPLVAAGLGAITGTLYRRGVGQGSLAAKMLLVFMYVYVLTSPIHSAFTIGNAMQTLMCLIGAAFLVQGLASGTPEPARPAGG